jgi:hypothetical protein
MSKILFFLEPIDPALKGSTAYVSLRFSRFALKIKTLDTPKMYSPLGVGGSGGQAQCCTECTVFSYVNDIAL